MGVQWEMIVVRTPVGPNVGSCLVWEEEEDDDNSILL